MCKDCVDAASGAAKGSEAAEPPAEPEQLDILNFIPLEPGPSEPGCPNCGAAMSPQAVVCIGCGYSRALGRVATSSDVSAKPGGRARKGRGRRCRKCGYSMAGLKSAQCPECGVVNTPPSTEEREKDEARSVRRNAYLKPLVYFAVGFGIVSVVLGANGGVDAVLAYALGYVVQVPIGVCVFIACCYLWIGFDAPVHLTALRLAGIYALVDLAHVIFGFIPIPVVGWLVPLIIYIGLLMDLLEMDMQDAIIVGLLTYIVKVALAIFIIAELVGLL